MANKTKYKRSKIEMIGTMQNYKAPIDEKALKDLYGFPIVLKGRGQSEPIKDEDIENYKEFLSNKNK